MPGRITHGSMTTRFEVWDVEPFVLPGHSHTGKPALPRTVSATWIIRHPSSGMSSGWMLQSVKITGTVMSVKGKPTANDVTREGIVRGGYLNWEWLDAVPEEIRNLVMSYAPGPYVDHS